MARKPSTPSVSAGNPSSTSSAPAPTSASSSSRIHPSYHQYSYPPPPPTTTGDYNNASAASSPSSWQPSYPPHSRATGTSIGATKPTQAYPGMHDYPASSPASTSYNASYSKGNSPSQASEDEDDPDGGYNDEGTSPASAKGKDKATKRAATSTSTSTSASASTSQGSKRQRVHFSCTECHRRKQKCNRQTPCQHCIARKVPERCKTFKPGHEEGMDLTARVAKLEKSLEEGFDRLAAMMAEHAANQQRVQTAAGANTSYQMPSSAQPRGPATTLPPPAQPSSQLQSERRVSFAPSAPGTVTNEGSDAGDEANNGAVLNDAGNFHGSGATISMRIDSLLSDVGGGEQSSSGEASQSATGQRKGILSMPTRSDAGSDKDDDLDSKMAEYGAVDKMSGAFASSVPSRGICRQLTDHYFDDVNWLRHPLPERLLRPQINAYIDAPGAFPAPLTTSNVNVFACMMLLMSVAALSAEIEAFPKDGKARRMAARRFEWTGRRTLLLSQVLGKDDILQVMGFNLAWRFLMLDRRMSEGWRCVSNSITAGYAIGLHRDGSKLGLPPLETDLRRGAWQTITFADLMLSMTFGRPPISDLDRSFSDTALPTLEGFKHWWPNEERTSHPRAKEGKPLPTIYQHTLNRVKIMRICGRIVECYQKLEPHHYSDILAIDAELLKVREELPYYYQATVKREDGRNSVECDRTLDDDFPFLMIHRFLCHTEVFFCRISLHRSYLLRSGAKGSSGNRYAQSRRACIEAAMDDLAMRTEFVQKLVKRYGGLGKIPLWVYIHIGTYSWFNSLLVASIAALLDPSDMPELPALRAQLNHFLRHADRKQAGLPPEDVTPDDSSATTGSATSPDETGNSRAHLEIKDEMREKEETILSMFRSAIDRAQANLAAKGAAEPARTAGSKRAMDEPAPSSRSAKASKGQETAASREEATADVLLDLGKGAKGGNAVGDVKTAEGPGSGSGYSSPKQGGSQQAQGKVTPSSHRATPPTPRTAAGSSNNAQQQQPLSHHLRNDSSAALDAQTPSAASTSSASTPFPSSGMLGAGVAPFPASSSVDSPSGNHAFSGHPQQQRPPHAQQQQQRSVDSAQADFNAWFANEFSMGMAMNLGGAGPDALVSPASAGHVGGGMAGYSVNGTSPGGGPNAGWAGAATFDGANGQPSSSAGPVQWSTLPRPNWDATPSSSVPSGSQAAPAFDAQGFFMNNVHPGGASTRTAGDPYAVAAANAAAARGGQGLRQQQQQQQQRAPDQSGAPGFLDPQLQQQQRGMPPGSWAPLGPQPQAGTQQGGMEGAPGGGGGGGGGDFDTAFWKDLISKISTT
ncbi:hypothetical protein BDZ90DRAFT_229876 [Jaminaea rosea]|uniref:Zn(2)-C6 fungal-type domain-containing protein n=1 Tax=Jaminaea rosea TaxID=1569628 RepID=A0A316V015_9BASI|nr:hypothetical protein BDZ90DRAFT_229876 [Jaminaea rosea]PWN30889.1 hypothetical protein BDZ90DRAFT_229876 [Jaminaea rosea]